MNKRAYIQANKDWLEAKSKEDGVKVLPKGIFYKVLSEGRSAEGRLQGKNQSSATPTVRSIITAHYTGKTIDGKQFDTNHGSVPLACRLCDLIEGWIIAIQQMHIGDKWEIYIPAEMGYGKFSQSGIPGGSTLIFEIELLGMTLRELLQSVDAEAYASVPLFEELLNTKPEYGSGNRIEVNLVNGEIAVSNVHVGSLGDIVASPIDVAPDLQVTKMQLLDAILKDLSVPVNREAA